MKFNENWTKDDNDKLRQMRIEKKSTKEIVDFFGMDKLEYHPDGKFNYGGVPTPFSIYKSMNSFINEMVVSELDTYFKSYKSDSKRVIGDYDYLNIFKTNSDTTYILEIETVIDKVSPFPDKTMYNISFTTKEQFYDSYEEETGKHEMIELLKRLIFIIKKIDIEIKSYNKNPIYIIGDTNNTKKIKIYRNVIENSLPEYIEIKGESSINNGKYCYYYYE